MQTIAKFSGLTAAALPAAYLCLCIGCATVSDLPGEEGESTVMRAVLAEAEAAGLAPSTGQVNVVTGATSEVAAFAESLEPGLPAAEAASAAPDEPGESIGEFDSGAPEHEPERETDPPGGDPDSGTVAEAGFLRSLLDIAPGKNIREKANAALMAALEDTDADVMGEYRINPLDSVGIEVYNEPDISKVFHVSSQGTINHPLLGKVTLSGLTRTEAEARVTELLGNEYLVDPRVTVSIEESKARRVIIFGEVKNPGAYQIPPDQRMSLLRLFALAGGFTDLAAINRVMVVRSVNGSEQTIKVNVADLLKGRGGTTDLDLVAGDVVTVPETRF